MVYLLRESLVQIVYDYAMTCYKHDNLDVYKIKKNCKNIVDAYH